MRTLLNIIWFVFGGVWLAIGYWGLGLLMVALIVTIPWGIASFRIGNFVLWPFGRTIISRPNKGVASTLGNIIWILVAGIPIVVGHVSTAIAQAVTIVGIPLAVANLKIIPISFAPLGKEIVPTDSPAARAPGADTFTL